MTTETRRAIALAAAAPSDPRWEENAACRTTDPDLFFPVGQSLEAQEQTNQAKRVCLGCSVRARCLDWAFTNGDQEGVFGGMSGKERREVMTVRNRSPKAIRPSAGMARCKAAAERIQELRDQEASVSRIAREVGVSRDTLSRWFQISEALQAAAGQEVAA